VFFVFDCFDNGACSIVDRKGGAEMIEIKYKPTKKFIKTVGMDVVSAGFPTTALASVVGAYRIRPDGGVTVALIDGVTSSHTVSSHLVLETDITIDVAAFLEWKNGIGVTDGVTGIIDGVALSHAVNRSNNNDILQKIRDFDLSNATPIMCMNFIAGIKSEPGFLSEL